MRRSVIRLILSTILIGSLAGSACLLAYSSPFAELADVAAM